MDFIMMVVFDSVNTQEQEYGLLLILLLLTPWLRAMLTNLRVQAVFFYNNFSLAFPGNLTGATFNPLKEPYKREKPTNNVTNIKNTIY